MQSVDYGNVRQPVGVGRLAQFLRNDHSARIENADGSHLVGQRGVEWHLVAMGGCGHEIFARGIEYHRVFGSHALHHLHEVIVNAQPAFQTVLKAQMAVHADIRHVGSGKVKPYPVIAVVKVYHRSKHGQTHHGSNEITQQPAQKVSCFSRNCHKIAAKLH